MNNTLDEGYCLAQDPSRPNVVYAGGTHLDEADYVSRMAVSKSLDGGASWTLRRDLTGEEGICRDIAVAPANSQIVYAVGAEESAGRVFRSANAGQSWSNVTGNLAAFHSAAWEVKAVFAHPTDYNLVYVATSRGVYVSWEGGQSWAATGLTRAAKAFAYDPVADVLYAAVEGDGVWFSRNAGQSWQAMNQGLGALKGLALAINPAQRYLFLATDGSGVWRTALVSPAAQAQPQWSHYR